MLRTELSSLPLRVWVGLLCVVAMTLVPVEEACGETSLGFRGRIPPGEFVALSYEPATGHAHVKVGEQQILSEVAALALQRAPAWLRDRLEDRFSRLPYAPRDSLAQLILDIEDPRLVDEVCFAMASVSVDHLDDSYQGAERCFDPSTLLLNAQALYEIDPLLQWSTPGTPSPHHAPRYWHLSYYPTPRRREQMRRSG